MLLGLFFAVALVSGGIAAIAGFGIGSLLTPLLALQIGAKLAVAAVSIPHFVGTALRFWILRAHVNRGVLWSFGVTSAVGGLSGAVLHAYASSRALALVLGTLLLLAGGSELAGVAPRLRFGRRAAWLAGAVSGALGGLVGNQGGIRSAAMLGFDVRKEEFVATTTAVGMFVDAARVPVYFVVEAADIAPAWPLVAAATAGIVAGTIAGERLLRHVAERTFRRLVAILLLALGGVMMAQG